MKIIKEPRTGKTAKPLISSLILYVILNWYVVIGVVFGLILGVLLHIYLVIPAAKFTRPRIKDESKDLMAKIYMELIKGKSNNAILENLSESEKKYYVET